MAEPHPELHRVLNAALIPSFAAVAPVTALALAALGRSPGAAGGVIGFSLLFSVPLALLHALVLGLPLYSLLRERWRLAALRAVIGGSAVGAGPSIARHWLPARRRG